MNEMYYVIENRNVGAPGKPEITSIILYSSEDKMACAKVEDEQRKKYKDTTMVDCFVKSQSQIDKERKMKEVWDNLTDEQKKDTIEIDGKTYVRAIYEMDNQALDNTPDL
jgi:hypothetical protein